MNATETNDVKQTRLGKGRVVAVAVDNLISLARTCLVPVFEEFKREGATAFPLEAS